MNLYRPHKGNGKRRLLYATIFVILLFGIDAITGGSIRALFRQGATLVWGVGNRIETVVFGSGFFSSRRALVAENESLKAEVAKLTVNAFAFNAIQEQNEALRKLIRLAEEAPGITAPIVSSFISSPYGTFTIGAGSAQGVRPGDHVLIGESGAGGFVVGRVDSVDTNTSLVKELFAPGETVEATVAGIAISLEGRGATQARASVPRGSGLMPGTTVTSPNLRGRSIGVVGAVEEEGGGAAERVYVHVPISVHDWKFVYVLAE